ncbi:helix-turn-helix domain-containing protein [Mesorhizobium sp. M0915]|uniref:helix-turn-helix domain-containing protein n=1 Tax=Mesorhizobium sp. M0915 TaxID=2957027 RepID=UPI003338FA76
MPQSLLRNHVLKTLSSEDFALLRPSMHHVELNIKDQLEVSYQPIERVYFPEMGIASVVATMTGGRQSEVGIVGHDGMTGVAVILGQDKSPNETYIQVAGTHEFLATMLGAQRPGVTTALQMLEYRGLVHAKRGEITIIDRVGMIRLTHGAYGEEEQSHFGLASA